MGKVKALSVRLADLDAALGELDGREEPEAWTVALSLQLIEEFCERFRAELLPAVLEAGRKDELEAALMEVAMGCLFAVRGMRLAESFRPWVELAMEGGDIDEPDPGR